MTARSARTLRSWLRDMALGAAIFLALPLLAQSLPADEPRLGFHGANASEVIAHDTDGDRRGQNPDAVWALSIETDAAGASRWLAARRAADLAVLGLTFSLLVACNLAFWRHLRRVSASPRRDGWRRGQ